MPRPYPTISKGTDGKWHAWVTVGTKPNGRPDQRHIKRASRGDVEVEVDKLLAQRRTGKVTKAGRKPTVEAWLTTYLDTIAPRKCDPSTIQGYRSKVRNYVYPDHGRTRLDRLTAEDLDAIYLAMARAGRADATILQTHRILSRALEIAFRRGLLPTNVAKLIDSPTAKKQEIEPLTEDEAVAVLAAAEGRRNAARWSVGLALGLRQGEALGLRWDYVDLQAGELRVWWQLHRRAWEHGCGQPCGRRRGGNCPERRMPMRSGETLIEGLILKAPKGTGKRTIPIPGELVEKLQAHREVQALERQFLGAAHDHGFVFARADGRPIDPADDWSEWKSLLSQAGVREARVHDGRHTAGTLMIAQGVPIEVVQEILGHSSVVVTRGYTHVASRMAREATERMGASLLNRRSTP